VGFFISQELPMTAKLPDGATVSLYAAYEPAVDISAITNGVEPVATADNTYLIGDLVLIKSSWSELNNRVVQVTQNTLTTFTFKGVDTTDTILFPPGNGYGEAIQISGPEIISQIMEFDTAGGEQQYLTYSYLEMNSEQQIPTIFSAQSISMVIADDPDMPGMQALKTASDNRALRVMSLALPGNTTIYYHGFVSLQDSPMIVKSELIKVKATLSLVARHTRF